MAELALDPRGLHAVVACLHSPDSFNTPHVSEYRHRYINCQVPEASLSVVK
jgi:hypothetical protein